MLVTRRVTFLTKKSNAFFGGLWIFADQDTYAKKGKQKNRSEAYFSKGLRQACILDKGKHAGTGQVALLLELF